MSSLRLNRPSADFNSAAENKNNVHWAAGQQQASFPIFYHAYVIADISRDLIFSKATEFDLQLGTRCFCPPQLIWSLSKVSIET